MDYKLDYKSTNNLATVLLIVGFLAGYVGGNFYPHAPISRIGGAPSVSFINEWHGVFQGQVVVLDGGFITVSVNEKSFSAQFTEKTIVSKTTVSSATREQTIQDNLKVSDIKTGDTVALGVSVDVSGGMSVDAVRILRILDNGSQ